MSVSSTIDDRVRAVAERQCGVVTREQLLNAGMSRGGLRHRLTIGRLRRLHPGVYLVGPMLLPRARQWAAVLACGPDAVLSHHDASELWLAERSALPANRGGRAPEARAVHVTVPHTGRKHKPGIRLHRVRALDPADCTSMDGIPVTTPIRTVLDLAPVLDLSKLERLIAHLAREGLLHLDELASRVAASPHRRGVRSLRAILTRSVGPALTRSEAEAAFLALVRKARLPAPEVNVRIGRYELDFYWPDARLAVEIDGFRHHSARPRFEGDRRKDAWLRARGLAVIRLTWRQITLEEMVTAVQLGQALAHTMR